MLGELNFGALNGWEVIPIVVLYFGLSFIGGCTVLQLKHIVSPYMYKTYIGKKERLKYWHNNSNVWLFTTKWRPPVMLYYNAGMCFDGFRYVCI